MTGSMYAAIAGLRTHMQNLNVIGHNIANVNTESYKSARSVFKTSIYSTTSGGSNGTEVAGGRNPSQIGYGSNLASVDIDMSTGTYKVTGKSTDLMLDGDGFFLIGDKTIPNNFTGGAEDVDTLTSLTLTRLGNFDFGADGFLDAGGGNVVYGFLCTGVITEDMYYKDPTAKPPEVNEDMVDKNIGDPIFSDQLVPIRYPRVQTVTEYRDADGNIVENVDPANPDKNLKAVEVTKIVYPQEDAAAGGHLTENEELKRGLFTGVTFDETTGLITATSNDTKQIVTIGCLAVGTVTNPNGVTQIGNTNYKAGPGSGDLMITTLGGASESMGINYVNSSLRQADPDNPDAVQGNIDGLRILYSPTTLKSNGLESSKADLAQEIANMIVTQRGYQANTRIITVTDSMLEELVNMKR